ncbi:MAG: hypothetical protein Q9169_006317 [Polycauliona sp. 2 TL-2023]
MRSQIPIQAKRLLIGVDPKEQIPRDSHSSHIKYTIHKFREIRAIIQALSTIRRCRNKWVYLRPVPPFDGDEILTTRQLPTVEEAEEAALEAWAKVVEDEEATANMIREAEDRTDMTLGVLNRYQVKEIQRIYGETFEKQGSHIKTIFAKWLLTDWLPEMRSKYEESAIKSKDEETRDRVRLVALSQFLEKVWFTASDYDLFPLLKRPVQYWRAKLHGSEDQPGIHVFNKQVEQVMLDLL